MRVLHVLSELYPLVKTGGLADAGSALLLALRKRRVDARPLLPGYPPVMAALGQRRVVWSDTDLFGGGPARLWSGTLSRPGLPALVLDAPNLFMRDGNPYMDDAGGDHTDNHRRFAALCWAAAVLASGADSEFEPQLVHGHDWQAGLTPAYLKQVFHNPVPTLHTVHNLNYVGGFDPAVWPELGLPDHAYDMHGVEFYGRISFLKAGLYFADRLSTVSPSYAREIQHAGHGAGFEGLLHTRRNVLYGFLNGIDEDEWNPSKDPHMVRPYDGRSLKAKRENRRALLEELGLSDDDDLPTFGVVSRLTWQKGLDLLSEAIDPLVQDGKLRLVVLGSGARELEDELRALALRHPRHVAVHIGYDEGLSHRVQAGCDALLVPSRTEPCGLTQMYALRYGTVPVVRRTGGLADTVVDVDAQDLADSRANGVVFDDITSLALRQAIERTCALYAQPKRWRELQRAGMRERHGWKYAVRPYLDLYEEMVPGARPPTNRPPETLEEGSPQS